MSREMQADPRQVLGFYYRWVLDFCLRSAAAVPADKRELKLNSSRSPREILQHAIGANHVFITGFKSQGELSAEERKRIEESFSDYDEALAELRRSGEELAGAIESIRPELLVKDGAPDLSRGSWLHRLQVASVHIVYHWGQLNFIQTTYGDHEMH